MGNQSTSGIAEERAESERGKSEGVSSPEELKEENKINIQENGLNLQEKAEKEEHRGSDDEDCETRIVDEPNASNLDEGRSRISNEEQDQLCTIKDLQGDQNVLVEKIDAHVEELVEAGTESVDGAVIETRVDKDCTPQEAVGITSQLQEDHDMLVKEIDDHDVEKTEGGLVEADTASVESAGLGMRVDKDITPQEEDVGITSDLQEDQVMLVKEIGDHVVEQREDEPVETDTACVEGSFLDTRVDKACTLQEAVGTVSDLEEYQHMLVKEIDDQVVEKHEYASVEASLLETRVEKDCTQQEAVAVTSVLQPDQNMLKEIDDHSHDLDEAEAAPTLLETRVDEDCTPQEAVDTASHPQDHDMLVKEIDDEKRDCSSDEENTASVEGRSRDELVKNDDHPQEKQSNSSTSLNELQSTSLLDSTAEELMMNELGIDECDHPSIVDQSQPSDQEIKHLLNEAPQQMIKDPNEGKHESAETRDFRSNTGSTNVEVELRKAPSFDFGLLFDARSEESDQTPLLFQDKAPMRSYSTCSNTRFQDRSVQTEYSGVEVEEKTIRMERSTSESSMAPPENFLKKESNAGVVARGKHENGDGLSPRGNGKRKPRSSLFTTCICCSAAIS